MSSTLSLRDCHSGALWNHYGLIDTDIFSCIERAIKDCTYVIHVASPFPAVNPRDEMEVIGPAVEGTKNVLEACAKTKGGVKRVVLTSSAAAIYGDEIFFICY